jgi:hypothetical protein
VLLTLVPLKSPNRAIEKSKHIVSSNLRDCWKLLLKWRGCQNGGLRSHSWARWNRAQTRGKQIESDTNRSARSDRRATTDSIENAIPSVIRSTKACVQHATSAPPPEVVRLVAMVTHAHPISMCAHASRLRSKPSGCVTIGTAQASLEKASTAPKALAPLNSQLG